MTSTVEAILQELSAPRWQDPHTLKSATALVDKLPSIDARDSLGRTALHLRVGLASGQTSEGARLRRFGQEAEDKARAVELAVVRLLLERGADPNALDHAGSPPLRAAITGLPEIMTLLLEHGAKVDAAGTDVRTALMDACYYNARDSFTLLADAGANLDAQDEAGRTALMFAVQQNNEFAVEQLLARGADRDLRGWAEDVKDKRASDLVRKSTAPAIRTLLAGEASKGSKASKGPKASPKPTPERTSKSKPVERGGITPAELDRRVRPHAGKPFVLAKAACEAHWCMKDPVTVLLFSWPTASDECKTRFAKAMRLLLARGNENLVPIGFSGNAKLASKSSIEDIGVRLPFGLFYCDLDLCTASKTPVFYWPWPMRSWGDIGKVAQNVEELMG